jgi:hypothetical protein
MATGPRGDTLTVRGFPAVGRTGEHGGGGSGWATAADSGVNRRKVEVSP